MRSNRLARAAASLAVFLALGAAPAPSPSLVGLQPPLFKTVAACANPKLLGMPAVQVDAPKATLHLVSAEDEKARELGLMCVTWIRPHSGMVFVFDRDDRWDFWMKNTLISLDMVWVRPDGRVDSVAARVPASTRTTPDDKVARRVGQGKFVIELAAGEAARDGIAPGVCLLMRTGDSPWRGCASPEPTR